MAAKQSAGDGRNRDAGHVDSGKETSEGSCSDDAVCIGDIVSTCGQCVYLCRRCFHPPWLSNKGN